METLDTRIKSFIKARPPGSSKVYSWPHPDSFVATPKLLAEAGFYFNPSKDDPDNVVCFLCGKELGGWDNTDDPFKIHAQKCPKCPWVLVRCALENDFDSKGSFVVADANRNPDSKTLEKARLETYGGKLKWWPHDSKKKHGATSKKMAKAGFVYTPQEHGDDTATCFYCNLALSGWDEDDDPLTEHRKRESRSRKSCPFLKALSAPVTSTSSRAKPSSSADLRASQMKRTEMISQTQISNESDDELLIEDKEPARKRKATIATSSRRIEDERASSQPALQKPPSKPKAPERSIAARGTRKSTRRVAPDNNEDKAEEGSTKKPLTRSTRSTQQSGQNKTKNSTNKGKEKITIGEVDSGLLVNDIFSPTTADLQHSQLSPIVEDKSHHTKRFSNPVDSNIAESKASFEAVIPPPDPPEEAVENQLGISLSFSTLVDVNFNTMDLAPPNGMDLSSSVPIMAPLESIPMKTITNLSEEERAMTVEEWINHEVDLQYEQLKRDGESRIEAFKQKAREIRAQIAAL